jgi:hypothetical protein
MFHGRHFPAGECGLAMGVVFDLLHDTYRILRFKQIRLKPILIQ